MILRKWPSPFRLPKISCALSMIIYIVIVIQKEVAGSASGGCTYGTVTGQTLRGVRSRPTLRPQEKKNFKIEPQIVVYFVAMIA